MNKPNQQKPRHPDPTEVDPAGGDALMKRLLQSKPKPHKDMVADRKAGDHSKPKQGKRK
jgi:hypothetical protein